MSATTMDALDMDSLYRNLYKYSNDAIVVHSFEGEIFMANPRAEAMFGWTEKELRSLYVYDLPSLSDKQKAKEARKRLMEYGFVRLNCDVNKKDQSIFPVEISSSLMKVGDFYVVQAIIRDLTSEKETLQRLEQTNQELNKRKHDLVEAQKIAHIGNWEYDVVSNTITWSEEIYRIFELDPHRFEATYEAFLASIHTEDVARVDRAYMASLTTKQPYHQRFRLVTSKGIKYVEDRCKHICDDEGNIVRSIGLVQDITGYVLKEQKIKHQEEMMIVQSRHAAMGEMISMIAHQWRQPISIVGLLAETMRQSLSSDTVGVEILQEDLEQIHHQVAYMSKTIEDFRNFFQKSNTVDEVHLRTLFAEVNTMLGAVLKRHAIELTIHCDASLSLHTYSRELIQVIINIVTNAKDALQKQEGVKEIRIEVTELDEAIRIAIFNNGAPIDEAIKYKIFEPYFTTKTKSGGTGLGLYMVKTIIDKHMHGEISVNNLDGGVEFVMTVPRSLQDED